MRRSSWLAVLGGLVLAGGGVPAVAQNIEEQATLAAEDPAGPDWFGFSTGLWGDSAIVGAFRYPNVAGNPDAVAGAAYVFGRDANGVWSQAGELTASDMTGGNEFGGSVDIYGNTAIVGALRADGAAGGQSGQAYIFQNNGGIWSETQILAPANVAQGDQFGSSVAIQGDRAVIGARLTNAGDETNSGAAYVYEYDEVSSQWVEQAMLAPAEHAANSWLGMKSALDGDVALVGTNRWGGSGSNGKVFAFHYEDGDWTEAGELAPNNPQANESFGHDMAISGDTAVVGAFRHGTEDDGDFERGSVYVFDRDGNEWSETAQLFASDWEVGGHFAYSVDIHGDIISVGAKRTDAAGTNSGAIYLFQRDSAGDWNELAKVVPDDLVANDRLGTAISVHGDTVLTGAFRAEKAYVHLVPEPTSLALLSLGAFGVMMRRRTTA
ncbi:PEP-CTERM sorting domain-containing protein [Phycisphaerales bacterium AB-hyl4]|uniref:PEP-CTERM sorting domain-containing protein n=1 Tax=Natronomicrosphaera hydrolytica TaxID=3242702 RepID=A0ABV4U4T7_9BACT